MIGIEGAAAQGVNSTRTTVATGTVHMKAAVRAREEARVLDARNTSRGALPTAGNREGIYFKSLSLFYVNISPLII